MSISTLPTSDTVPTLTSALQSTDVILDAIFGFSFAPPVRAPFDAVLPLLARSGRPIVSVDIPSGWDVERGKMAVDVKNLEGEGATKFEGLEPDVLISLTAPKLGVKEFRGRHYLGGRFVSKCVSLIHPVYESPLIDIHVFNREFEQRFEMNLPEYPGYEQIVELPQNNGQKL